MTQDNSITASNSAECILRYTVSLVNTPVQFHFHAAMYIARSNFQTTNAKDDTKLPFSRDALAVVVSQAMRGTYRGARHAAKHLAGLLKIAPVSARAYLEGRRVPCARNLLQMMAISRDLRTRIDRLVDHLEATHLAALHDIGKTGQLSISRRHDVEFRDGDIAPARLGSSQDWYADSFWLWNHIVLVDVAQIVGRVCQQPESAEASQPHAGGCKTLVHA